MPASLTPQLLYSACQRNQHHVNKKYVVRWSTQALLDHGFCGLGAPGWMSTVEGSSGIQFPRRIFLSGDPRLPSQMKGWYFVSLTYNGWSFTDFWDALKAYFMTLHKVLDFVFNGVALFGCNTSFGPTLLLNQNLDFSNFLLCFLTLISANCNLNVRMPWNFLRQLN